MIIQNGCDLGASLIILKCEIYYSNDKNVSMSPNLIHYIDNTLRTMCPVCSSHITVKYIITKYKCRTYSDRICVNIPEVSSKFLNQNLNSSKATIELMKNKVNL